MKKIVIAGIGMGGRLCLTGQAEEALRRADLVFGSGRMLSSVENYGIIPQSAVKINAYTYENIKPALKRDFNMALILMSGDTGFYSGAKKLYGAIKEDEEMSGLKLELLPGISSVSYLAAKTGVGYEDAKVISLHGKDDALWKPLLADSVRYCGHTFAICSGLSQLKEAGQLLMEYMPSPETISVTIGCQLSYEDELIQSFSLEELCNETSLKEGLYTFLVRSSAPSPRRIGCGIEDSEFIRGKVPLTKQEVRHIAVDMLKLTEGAVLYDLGCGTGSVGIEAAMASASIRVFGVDKNPEAVSLTMENAVKFGCANVKAVCGDALEFVMDPLNPAPTHAFIGGSGGEMKKLAEALRNRNPEIKIVITAVTLESRAELVELMGRESEMIELGVSRSKNIGNYRMLMAENPIAIVSL